MKSFITACLGLGSVALAAVPGFDISHYQANVNFAAAYSSGARFVIIKVILKPIIQSLKCILD